MMSLVEFFARFQLHDSGVEGAERLQAQGLFRLRIELCNYDQPNFAPGDPEMLTGWIEFGGISEFTASPPLQSIHWGPTLDGEILVAEIVDPPSCDLAPRAKIVISLMNYHSKTKDVLVITFRASTVDWIVDRAA